MFKITNQNGDSIDCKIFLFPAGEVGVKLAAPNVKFFKTNETHKYTISARLHDSKDVMTLAMIKNAIENEDREAVIDLFMPYIPYARQDRICDRGEAFSLKVFTNFINSLGFAKVTVCDPHSEVAVALLDRVKVKSQLDIINKFPAFRNRLTNGNVILVAPDAGGNKKTSNIAAFFGHYDFVRADKLRDLTNGNIKETIVYSADLGGADVVICDDICDGGMTFIKLAEALRAKNCGKVILYVTHGVFSKGIKHLLDSGIDEIYTTDSFTANFGGYTPHPPQFNVLNLESEL